jgi:hypothetical protein
VASQTPNTKINRRRRCGVCTSGNGSTTLTPARAASFTSGRCYGFDVFFSVSLDRAEVERIKHCIYPGPQKQAEGEQVSQEHGEHQEQNVEQEVASAVMT